MKLKTFFISMLILISTILFVFAAGPSYTNLRTNTTSPINGTDVMINVTWTGINDSRINFTWCSNNFTGTWINETPVARNFSTNVTHTNVTQFTAGWSTTGCYYCNATDISDNSNQTDMRCITSAARNPSVSIADIDFGDVELNTTTSSTSFNITNNGNVDLTNINLKWSATYDKYKINFTNVTSPLSVGSSYTGNVTIFINENHSTGSLTVPITFNSTEKTTSFNLKANVLGRLRITDLDIKIDDKTDSNLADKSDGYKIGEKAKPESHIKFDVKVENAFPNDGPEIRDITVTITIEEIDEDGDDLEEESEEFDLDAGKNKKISLEFDVPLKVDENEYNVIIEIKGEDENDNDHEVEKTLTLEVDKESHALKIRRVSLSPTVVECDRRAELDVTVINIGSRTEEEVVIAVKNSALGIDLAERDIELSEDPDDDNNEYKKTFNINIGDTVQAGTYTIETRAYYDEDKLEDLERATLQVKDCKPVTPEEEEEEEIEVITPPEKEEVTPPVEEEKKFTETTEYILILVLVNLVVVMIVVGLLIPLFRK